MDKKELIKNTIISAMTESYKQQAEYQKIDADELIQQNQVGMDIFATELTARIMLIVSN